MSAALSTESQTKQAKEIKGEEQPIYALIQTSLLPSFQVARTKASLTKTLEWRRNNTPRALISEAKSMLPRLDLLHLSEIQGKYALGYGPTNIYLRTTLGLAKLGLAALELLVDLLLTYTPGDDAPNGWTSLCVVDFRLRDIPPNRTGRSSFRATVRMALEELVSRIHCHYPGLLEKIYIIHSSDKYLPSLDIPEYLLRQTVLFQDPKDLVLHLGPDVSLEYGGQGAPLATSDLLKQADVDGRSDKVELDTNQPSESVPTSATACSGQNSDTAETSHSPHQPTDTQPSGGPDPEGTDPRLFYSETIGPPDIILDPEDLKTAEAVYGYEVRLAEAEAMFLVSKQTTIATPKLLSAYVLDGTGYILMSYEEGEPLAHYWDRVPEAEQEKILQQLRNYVGQTRAVKGDFIGGIDCSSCCDGIFEGGFGDYTKYSFGPYESEESFNEGIVQALQDRLPAELLEREGDPDSVFFTCEFLLYQTVRGLKGHEIVFTHGDHDGNIIVRADGTVVLLDSGSAGFWPEYWEFYRAMFGSPWKVSWGRMVEKFIPPYYVGSAIMQKVSAIVWY
ncbi:hypothetical protein BJX96DRAFT_187327 [Aspergillus floccosus]